MLSIVLSRRDFRESDQIISLYTKEEGKLELLARGIKKITSKHSAQVEPFSVVDIEVARGKEIDHLTKVQPVEYFSSIRQDMEKSLAAGYVVSLVDKLTQTGEKEVRIFELLKSWLEFTNQCNQFKSAQSLIDGYIVKLLNCLGFRPELERCVMCGVSVIASNRRERSNPSESATLRDPVDRHAPTCVGARDDRLGLYPAGGGVICRACRERKEALGEQILDCDAEQAKNLALLLACDWQLINNLKFEEDEADLLHNLVQQYAVFHSEKKLRIFLVDKGFNS